MNLSDYFSLSEHSKSELNDFYTFLQNRAKENNTVPYGMLVQSENPAISDIFIKYLQIQSATDQISDYYTLFHMNSGLNPADYNLNNCIYVITLDVNSDIKQLQSVFNSNPNAIKLVFVAPGIALEKLKEDTGLYYRMLPKHIMIWEPDCIAIFNRFMVAMSAKYIHISENFMNDMKYYVDTVYNDNPEIQDEEEFVTDLCIRVERKMAEGNSVSYYTNNELDSDLVPYSAKVQARKAIEPQMSTISVPEDIAPKPLTIDNLIFDEKDCPDFTVCSKASSQRKNILLVALSSFPGNKLLKHSSFTYGGMLNTTRAEITIDNCYYQLDPIPKLLRTLHIPLDKVIVLATGITKTNGNITIADAGSFSDVSPLTFFKKISLHNSFRESQPEASIDVIDLDEFSPQAAIRDSAKAIQDLAKDKKINLYIDNHGGFRDIQLITEAITTLIANSNIDTHFFNVRYSSEENFITDDTSTQIFDLVSGIKELSLYGRMESLRKYANGSSPELIQPLNAIAESILWCDAERFFPAVENLKKYFDNPIFSADDNGFLPLFEKQIKEDFQPLFDTIDIYHELDAVETIRWCMKKGLYQQAITVLESKMADTLCHRHIIRIEGNYQYSNKKGISNKDLFDGCVYSFHSDKSGVKLIYKIERFNEGLRSNILEENIQKACDLYRPKDKQSISDTQVINQARNSSVRDRKPKKQNNSSTEYNGKNGSTIEFKEVLSFHESLTESPDKKYLRALFSLHAILKDFRNNTNHMIDNDFDTTAVKNALETYVCLVDELTNLVSPKVN